MVRDELQPGLRGDILEDRRRGRPLLVAADELLVVLVAGGQLEVEVIEAEVAQQPEDEVEQVLDLRRRLFRRHVGDDLPPASTGLGRIDLSNLTDEDNLVPAYASDLMAATQGTVYGIACIDDTLVFGVNGVGAYKQATSLVESGVIQGGIVVFAMFVVIINLLMDLLYIIVDPRIRMQ